jgi:hypothetical protein
MWEFEWISHWEMVWEGVAGWGRVEEAGVVFERDPEEVRLSLHLFIYPTNLLFDLRSPFIRKSAPLSCPFGGSLEVFYLHKLDDAFWTKDFLDIEDMVNLLIFAFWINSTLFVSSWSEDHMLWLEVIFYHSFKVVLRSEIVVFELYRTACQGI